MQLYTEDKYCKIKKTLKPCHLTNHVTEIIAKVAAPHVYGEKFVKLAIIDCANEVL